MIEYEVRTHPSAAGLARPDQLAWKLAAVAADPVAVPAEVTEMVINRIIDNAAVGGRVVARGPVRPPASSRWPSVLAGAAVFGVDGRSDSPEWAAWANGVAVRELDFHDTFLAAEYSHPGDNIPPLRGGRPAAGVRGSDLMRGLATAYEVQVDLVKGICLHEHKIDHIAHLGPSVAAGLGTHAAAGHRHHLPGRSGRRCTDHRDPPIPQGEISSWKAFAPRFAGKVAIEAVDRAMRGEGSPAPIWEGEDGVIAWLLGGPRA